VVCLFYKNVLEAVRTSVMFSKDVKYVSDRKRFEECKKKKRKKQKDSKGEEKKKLQTSLTDKMNIYCRIRVYLSDCLTRIRHQGLSFIYLQNRFQWRQPVRKVTKSGFQTNKNFLTN
jgi:hypothetical protein